MPGREVHCDTGIGVPVREDVVARATIEAVGAGSAFEGVVAAIAGERIGVRRAPDILEAADRVALGVTARYGPGSQIHRDPRVRIPVRQDVVARATVEAVGAGSAFEGVIAVPANEAVGTAPTVEPVGSAVAGEAVAVLAGTQDVLESADGVALGVAAR